MMNSSLINTGIILAKNLAYNSRYLLFIEDLEGLGKLVDGVMEVEEVVYVVLTGPEGKQLAAKSKGNLYPDPTFAKGVLASSASEPVITSFSVRGKNMKEVRVSRGQARTMFMPADVEALEDFAVPVMRKSLPQPIMPPFELESPAPQSPDKVYGVVQVGMTMAIATTLDLDKLLATVLRLVIQNVGFSNARLVLYDSDRRVAYGSRLAGVPEELDREWRDVEVPVQDDGSLLAELLIHGRPVLIEDIGAAAHRLTPFNLKPIREAGVISIVCAPAQ